MAAKHLEYVRANGDLAKLELDEIEEMSPSRFAIYDGTLVEVVRGTRYDHAIYKQNVMVIAQKAHKTFQRGLEQPNPFANDPSTYIQTLVQTNMTNKGGEFDESDTVVIKDIKINLPVFGGKPTAQLGGVCTNAKVTSFPNSIDPAMIALRFLNQLYVEFLKGQDVILREKAIRFASDETIRAIYGANASAYANNGGGKNLMKSVIVLRGGKDFGVRLTPLADFDLTTATGIDMELPLEVQLETTELRGQ